MATRSPDERRRPRKEKGGRGRTARGTEVGVKRNIFQQISHVCLIMYITACGAENQSTTAATTAAAATTVAAAAVGVASHPASSHPTPSSSDKRGETRSTRSRQYFILIINSSCAWPIAIRHLGRNAEFRVVADSLTSPLPPHLPFPLLLIVYIPCHG
ncbi:hypothetical protein ACS0PU_002876 [Formica fusca]